MWSLLSSTNIGMIQMIVGIIQMQATTPNTTLFPLDRVRVHQSAAGADSAIVTTAPMPAAIVEFRSDRPRLPDCQADVNWVKTNGWGRPSRLLASFSLDLKAVMIRK